MPDLVEPRLAVLPTLSKAALGDLWKQFFGCYVARQLRRDLMIPILAYRIQEQTFGSLSARAQRYSYPLVSTFTRRTRSPHWRTSRVPGRMCGAPATTGLPFSKARLRPLPKSLRHCPPDYRHAVVRTTVFRNQTRVRKETKSKLEGSAPRQIGTGLALGVKRFPSRPTNLRGWREYAANVCPVQGITTSGRPPRH
jgi:Protein of unknown function (DUF2924)